MNNGIKPTRLWHLTGKKHFQKIISDREKAVDMGHREKIPQLQLVGIVLSCVAALSYSFGRYSEPADPKTIIRIDPCKDSTKVKRDLTKLGPCPDDYYPPLPACPAYPSQATKEAERATDCPTCKCPCKGEADSCSYKKNKK